MPKIEIEKAEERQGSGYPAPFAKDVAQRRVKRLSRAADLTQFAANLVIVPPHSISSQRHWHEQEDEFLVILSGEVFLIEETGETPMGPGDCAGFKAGIANGHHLANRSAHEARFIVIGPRGHTGKCHYPDLDLLAIDDEKGGRYVHKSGEPYDA